MGFGHVTVDTREDLGSEGLGSRSQAEAGVELGCCGPV